MSTGDEYGSEIRFTEESVRASTEVKLSVGGLRSAPLSSDSDFRQAIGQFLRWSLASGHLPAVQAELRRDIARICSMARERNLRAEELLLVLKSEAFGHYPDASVPRSRGVASAFSQIVTLFIHEYYQPQ